MEAATTMMNGDNDSVVGEKRSRDAMNAECEDLASNSNPSKIALPSSPAEVAGSGDQEVAEEEEEERLGGDAKASVKEEGWELDPSGSIALSFIKASEDFATRAVCSGCTKKRFAIALAYLGTRYKGLQINPGVVTIEGLLERALYLAGGFEEHNFGELRKLGWSRSGRTDKGVHAAANCCSMKLSVEPGREDEFLEKVNTYLPSDLRVVAMTKTLNSFNAKEHCSSRRYQYLIPTYTLADKETTNALMKEMLSGAALELGAVVSSDRPRYLSAAAEASLRSRLAAHRMGDADLERFRSLLARYKGTRSYHNFTSDVAGDDKSAKRYILSMDCSDPFVCNIPGSDGSSGVGGGVEWVCITIHGQSFLLNQIRKMIGLAVEVFRGDRSDDIFDKCFSPSEKVSISMVPGLGLYLMELFFERYNLKAGYELDKWQKTQQKREAEGAANRPGAQEVVEPGGLIQWSADPCTAARVEAFKADVIWPHIFQQEHEHLVFVKYLDHLRTQPLRRAGPPAADKS